MNTYPALIVAGIVFGIVALVHVFRLVYKTEIRVAGKIVPIWLSVVGFVLALILSVWMFMAGT